MRTLGSSVVVGSVGANMRTSLTADSSETTRHFTPRSSQRRCSVELSDLPINQHHESCYVEFYSFRIAEKIVHAVTELFCPQPASTAF